MRRDENVGNEQVINHVTSADGTRIGYLTTGAGPGLVLVQGAMATAHQFSELADALSTAFTVHTPDRRGRGMSPLPFDHRHTIDRDIDDIDAVLTATGATRVFGLSSGAVITLKAAHTLDRITHACVYEPPLHDHDRPSPAGIRRLDTEIERGHTAAALVTALRTAGTMPAPLRVVPRPIARLLAGLALAVDDRGTDGEAALRDLVPGVRYDFAAVRGMSGRMRILADLDKPILLLTGSKSPEFLRRGTRDLEALLPQGTLVEFTGLDHSGPWNAGRGGHPALIARALKDFLNRPDPPVPNNR